jgi:hypothetical protein
MLIDLLLIVSWIAAVITVWFTWTSNYNSPAKHNVGLAAVLWLVALFASEYEVPTAYLCWLIPIYFFLGGFRFWYEDTSASSDRFDSSGWAFVWWLLFTPIAFMVGVLHIA